MPAPSISPISSMMPDMATDIAATSTRVRGRLVYFLRQTRPQEFAAFLDLFAFPTTAKRSGFRSIRPSQQAFSRSLAALRTENAPPS